MRYYAIDCETRDEGLQDRGPSHFWGEGEIIVVGLYDCQKKREGYLDGNGGGAIKSLLTSPDVTLIGTNIQYDLLWLCYEHKLKVKECVCGLIDISVAESLIDEYAPFSLDDLAWKYLKTRKGIDTLKNICATLNLKGDARKHLGTLWDKGYKDEIRDYVISDVKQPAEIWKTQEKLLKKEGAFPAFLVNMRCVKILAASRQRGIRVDYERWKENCDAVKPIHDKAEKEFFKKYGEVNINSPKQMGDFMVKNNVPFRNRITVRGWEPEGRKFSKKLDQFTGKEIWDERKRLKEDFPGIRVEKDKLRLYVDNKYAHRTEEQLTRAGYNITSTPNIDKFFVKENKAEFPVVADLETYKQVKSIISKFLGPKFGRFIVDNGNGEYRVHPEVNVVGARMTSRMSSSKFNAQNIPSKTKLFEGTEHEVDLSVMCREIFIPEKGHIWVKLDYSGQEAILQAHFAVGEAGEVIRARYHENSRLDTHQFVADVSGLSNEFSRKTARKYAKNLNFGLAYGMQQARMSAQFGWDKELTERLYEQITSASPWIKETMEAVEEAVTERGYVMTLLGRRSHLKKGDENKLYVFYNKLIQGSGSDQLKLSLAALDDEDLCDYFLLPVHDELNFSLPMTKVGLTALRKMQSTMESAADLDVPVHCDPECGITWAHGEGQYKYTEDDAKEGKCTEKEITYPKETLQQLWTRMCADVRKGKKARVRVFDDAEVGLEDDEEEEDEA